MRREERVGAIRVFPQVASEEAVRGREVSQVLTASLFDESMASKIVYKP